MNYEQKYKEALERAKKEWIENLDNCYTNYRERLEIIFPELAESKDERIRKELIEHIKANYEADYVLFKKFSPDDVIAWLEKQGGEQKQAWKPNAAQLIVIKDLIEDKNTSKVNKVILRGMLDELNNPQFSSGHLLDSDKVIAWLVANICGNEYYVKLFKQDFGL